MAYTEVPTYTTNQLITAAHANTYWRDNINELWPFADAGDMAYASAATTLEKLAIGAAGRRLGSNGSAPAWLYGAPMSIYGAKNGGGVWQSTTASAWQDVTGASMTITLPVQSVIFGICTYVMKSNGSGDAFGRLVLDGHYGEQSNVGDTDYFSATSMDIKVCDAGDRIIKLQSYAYLGDKSTVYRVRIIALGFPVA